MSAPRTRVLFTGAPGALAGLGAAVEAEGAVFSEWPLLAFAPPADPEPLEAAFLQLERYAAIAITSPRAAEAVARVIEQQDIDLTLAPTVWTSPSCAALLRPLFPRVEVSPRDRGGSLGVVLAEMMLEGDVGSPVLLPCGDLAREELATALREGGRAVEVVEAYRTVLSPASDAQAAMAAADIIVVTSPSVARLLAAVEQRDCPALVAIGPTTAGEARRHGWTPDAVAASPAVPAVAAAIHSLLPSYS